MIRKRVGLVGRAGLVGLLVFLAWPVLSQSARPAAPSRPGAPDRPGQPAPPAAEKPKNRLFAAEDLGLIEPPDRDQWQPPELIMDDLNIAEGAVVADIGAGGGWFTIRLARRVAPNGIVYAEDVQPQMLDLIRRHAQRENVGNIVKTVLGTPNDPMLPRGIDAAIIVDAYREMACAPKKACEEPVALLRNVARSLKPQGRLGILDFNPGDGGPGPAHDERIDPEAVIGTAAKAGLQLISRKSVPPSNFQFLLIFGKPANARG